MRVFSYSIETEFEQVALFVKWAIKYSSVWHRFCPEYLQWSIEDMYRRLQSLYTREEGEQILRPDYTIRIGGDCDDLFICIVSWWLALGVPLNKIYVVLARRRGESDYTHIYPALLENVGLVHYDMLPDKNITLFPEKNIETIIKPVTSYLGNYDGR